MDGEAFAAHIIKDKERSIMEYTSLFHLPQWAEEDRILMTDFNAAMARIEAGLAGARERAFRQAYNWLGQLAELPAQPAQKGCFYQRAEGGLPEGFSGLAAGNGCWWVSAGTEETTPAQVRATASAVQSLTLTKGNLAGCQPLIAAFRLQGPGRLTQLNMKGAYSENGGCHGIFRLAVYNTDAGGLEAEAEVRLSRDVSGGSGASGTVFMACDLPLRGACGYRLELTPTEGNWTLSYAYDDLTVKPLTASAASGSVGGTLAEAGEQGGLALVRYTVQGKGAALALDWDGETLAPASTAERGGVYTAEFRKNGPVAAGSRAALRLAAVPDGGASVLGWGAMVL